MIFNRIGGGGSGTPSLSFETWYGDAPEDVAATFEQPPAPSEEGYVFEGWFTDEACESAYDWGSEAESATLHAKWSIAQPTVSPAEPGTYDGTEKALGTVAAKGAGQSVEYSLDGSAWSSAAPKATDAGEYTVRWRVTAEHCDTLSGAFSVSIEEAEISATASGTSTTYTGSPVTANAVAVSSPSSGYEVRYATSEGDYSLAAPPSFTNAGEHTVWYRVTADNYETLTGSYVVSIAKAGCSLSIAPTSLHVKEGEGDGTISVTRTGGGAVTAQAANPSLCGVSVSGTTVTVSYVGAGTTSVTIAVAETENYLGATASCSVELEAAIEIVPWASGTDAQIAAMVAAADAGTIDLSDYWSAGDTRTVQLSSMQRGAVGETHAAQSVQLVLSDPGHYTLANGQPCHFTVIQKDCLKETGYMNASNTNSGGWNGCARRTWCNETYRNAMPSALRPIFKQFKTRAANGSGSSAVESTDYFALPSEKEIFGSISYSNSSAEAQNSQLDYYKTTTNRVKRLGTNGSAGWWWERSPGSGYSIGFCAVYSSGSANFGASYSRGLAPFGCI